MRLSIVVATAVAGLATPLVVLAQAFAYRDAARRRPELEAVCADHDEEPLPLRLRASAFVAECLLTLLLPVLGVLGPRSTSGARAALLRPGRAPVLLVTPRWCRGLAWPLSAFLGSRGWTTIGVASADALLTPALAGLADAVRRTRDAGGGDVDIVAFGSAGLAARVFACEPTSPVRHLVTVGTPHLGTHARWPFGGRALRPDGALVQQAVTSGGRADVTCTTIYSTDDPALLPATNAYLHGALAIELRGLGHVSTFAAPRVLALISDALDDTTAASLPVAS